MKEHADALGIAAQNAQTEAEIKNAAIRAAERQAKHEAWSDPDAMAYRKILNDKAAFESLQAMKASGQCVLQFPIPPDSELPPEMRGQQPSTVRRWMASSGEYGGKIREFEAAAKAKDARKSELKARFPDLFGISDQDARRAWKPPEDAPAPSKAAFTVKVKDTPPPSPDLPEQKSVLEGKKPGLVARIFAGLIK